MAKRNRCESCGRLTVTAGPFSTAPLEPLLDTLRRAAHEFDLATPPGEHYTALDFADWLAMTRRAEAFMAAANDKRLRDEAA